MDERLGHRTIPLLSLAHHTMSSNFCYASGPGLPGVFKGPWSWNRTSWTFSRQKSRHYGQQTSRRRPAVGEKSALALTHPRRANSLAEERG